MDPIDAQTELGTLEVSKDAIIETVAEAVLTEQKHVAVINDMGEIVGSVHASKVIHMLFGRSHAAEIKG